jgi:hypothetical protein
VKVCCDSERHHTCLKIALSVENNQNKRAIITDRAIFKPIEAVGNLLNSKMLKFLCNDSLYITSLFMVAMQ